MVLKRWLLSWSEARFRLSFWSPVFFSTKAIAILVVWPGPTLRPSPRQDALYCCSAPEWPRHLKSVPHLESVLMICISTLSKFKKLWRVVNSERWKEGSWLIKMDSNDRVISIFRPRHRKRLPIVRKFSAIWGAWMVSKNNWSRSWSTFASSSAAGEPLGHGGGGQPSTLEIHNDQSISASCQFAK